MKKLLGLLLFLTLATCFLVIGTPKASAASFNPNEIIDDGIFNNTQSMSASQIDAFLNSLPGSCISTDSGFEAIDPIGYSPSTGYTFGGWVSAGQVIYDAAQAFDLNPQVLLTMLQAQQSLVSGDSTICNASNQNQYAAAMGYGCPDGGTTYSYSNVNLYERNGVMVSSTSDTCVNEASAVGFSQQIINAAWLVKNERRAISDGQ
jgi:hypothetical protein